MTDKGENWKKPFIFLATGFGLGWSPIASGTVGTIPGIFIVLALTSLQLGWQILIAALLVLVAIPICDLAEKHFRIKDDYRIVADEFLTFPICMLGLPPEARVLGIAFLTNRLMDVLKPPPARSLQKLPGGIGITIDDTVSSLYSLLLNHMLYWFIWGAGSNLIIAVNKAASAFLSAHSI